MFLWKKKIYGKQYTTIQFLKITMVVLFQHKYMWFLVKVRKERMEGGRQGGRKEGRKKERKTTSYLSCKWNLINKTNT